MWYYTYRQRELYERAGWFSFCPKWYSTFPPPLLLYKVFLHCTASSATARTTRRYVCDDDVLTVRARDTPAPVHVREAR